jgi:hypothetical protein
MQATMFKRATVGGRVETFVDGRTFGELMADGLGTELSYLTPDAQAAAIALEEELTLDALDALAGVDLRARLVGAAISQ